MTYRIALIPGDGIGKEVVPEAVEIIKALSKQQETEVAETVPLPVTAQT